MLASEDHLKEVMCQLQLVGEVRLKHLNAYHVMVTGTGMVIAACLLLLPMLFQHKNHTYMPISNFD